MWLTPTPTIWSIIHDKHLRVRTVLLGVSNSQIIAVHHKYVKLSNFLDVVQSKLDASLDFDVANVSQVKAADAAIDLFNFES